jgi:tetratricopeptide (TPR) repeat protein
MTAMHRALAAVFALSAGALPAAAQDVLKFRDPKTPDMPCEVFSLTYKTVEFEPAAAAGTRLKEDAKNILTIIPDPNRKTFDFAHAEQAFNGGELEEAAQRFERVRRDPRAPDLLRQLAAIYIVRCLWARDNIPGTLAAIKNLRQDRPDSFFLLESYDYEIRCHLARRDEKAAAQAVAEMEAKGKEGLPEWTKLAEVRRGAILELQGRPRDALAVYRKYVRDREVSEEAILGELRCLRELGDWGGLNGRAQQLLDELRGRKDASARLLTGAYNARGEFLLNGGRVKDALLDFMQGVAVLNRGGETSREHETALARAAFCCAKLAAQEKDKAKKDLYRARAQELLAELERAYPSSALRSETAKAIQEVR